LSSSPKSREAYAVRFVVTTDHLAPSERFEFWHNMLAEQTSPVHARSRFADSFGGTLRATTSTNFNLIVTDNDTVDVARTPATIRKGDAGVFYLVVNYRGVQQFTLDRDVIDLGPFDVVLLHSSRRLYSRSDPGLRRQRGAMVFVSTDAVPGGERQLRRLVGRRLSSQDGLVPFVAKHLYLLGTSEFEGDDAEQVMAVSSALISMMLARALQTDLALPNETRSDALTARIRSYITANLADPSLNANTVAAAHHISTRTLQRHFQASGVPFSAMIRQLRLERCRLEILDPARSHVPIRLIARRWGFPDASHFTRAYKAAYGLSPSDERMQARQ
jgi:AraC-like DNA-binding protein